MRDPLESNPALRAVIEEYEARAAREDELWSRLSLEEIRSRLDELLLPVGRAAATLMYVLVSEGKRQRILEVGSSYGYSTVWLAAAAAASDGQVTSLELRDYKTEYARERLERAGLGARVRFRIGDALASLRELPGPFDFVLLDLWKELYIPVFELLQGKLAPGALILADNMLEPQATRPQADAYRARVRAAAGMSSVLLEVGNGVELSRYG